MIAQIGFLLGLYVLGILFGLAFMRSLPIVFIGLSGLLWGALLWVLLVLVYVVTGNAFGLYHVLIPLVGIAGYFAWRMDWPQVRASWRPLVLLAFLHMIFISLFTLLNYSVTSPDSYFLVHSGRSLSDGLTGGLTWRALFVAGLHAGHVFGFAYLSAYPPLIATMGLLLLGYMIYYAGVQIQPVSTRWQVVALMAVGVLITAPLIQFQFVFIHENMTTAVFMLIAVVSLWLSMKTDEVAWRISAGASIMALGLLRLETPIIAVMLILLYLSLARMTFRERLTFALPPLLVNIGYHLFILTITSDATYMTPGPQMVIVLVLLGAVVGLLLTGFMPIAGWLLDNGWWLMVLIVIGALIFTFLTRPDYMVDSLETTLSNAWVSGWGASWLAVGSLLTVGLLLPSVPHERWLVLVTFFYMSFVMIFVYLREVPYRLNWADSGNRMLLHIVLIVVFYLAIKFGYALNQSSFTVPVWKRTVLAAVVAFVIGTLIF